MEYHLTAHVIAVNGWSGPDWLIGDEDEFALAENYAY